LQSVKHCGTNTFLLGEDEDHDDHKHESVDMKEITVHEFLENANSTDQYVYYSAPVEWWGKNFEEDITPNEQFYFRKVSDKEDTFVTMIWMGSSGVTAQLHYDEPVNFFVQVYGRKVCARQY
jgi:hypothetical protein